MTLPKEKLHEHRRWKSCLDFGYSSAWTQKSLFLSNSNW